MRTHIAIGVFALVVALLGAFGGAASTLSGQKMAGNERSVPDPAPKLPPAPEPEQPRIPALRVYEWGVSTINWDGSPEADENMPAAFYPADRIAIEPPIARTQKPVVKPDEPQPPKPGPIKPRKPVLYFEHDLAASKRLQFDLDIRFPNGRVTWVYPKANRRLDAATVQWDNIELVNAETHKLIGKPVPRQALFPGEHWATISRRGGGANLYVNGEHESYLFYEGEQFDLPELDLFHAPDGSLRVQNHGAHPVYDVRVAVAGKHYFVQTIAAASGERPAEVTITDANSIEWGLKTNFLIDETKAAGLTDLQAQVFSTIWNGELTAHPNSLSWRRSTRALDEMAEIKLTLPVGMASEVKRVGYVLVHKPDLSKQPDLDAKAAKAAGGDAEAAKALKLAGMSGAGAMRRKLQDESLPLAQKLNLAKALAEMRTR